MEETKKTCLVLLCTYNGEKYLKQQLDSILNQDEVNVFIKVADDCSTDNTVEILETYKTCYNNFDYFINKTNKKFTYNFIDLLFSTKDTFYDYYAFSDQDDVWQHNKLSKAIEAIETHRKSNKGFLYCSNLIVVDENLNFIRLQENTNILKADKKTFLYKNIATGCTIVFDQNFHARCLRYYPTNIYLHDYWLFLIAAYTAEFIYDINGYILYRQHSNNQIGSNKFGLSWSRVKRFIQYKGPQSKLAAELINGYKDDIDKTDLVNLTQLSLYKNRLRYKLNLLFFKKCNGFLETLLFKLKILFNKL